MKKNHYSLLIVFFAITFALSGCTQLNSEPEKTVMEEQASDEEHTIMKEESDQEINDEEDDDEIEENGDEEMSIELGTWQMSENLYESTVEYEIPNDSKEIIEFSIAVDDDGIVTNVDYESIGEPAPISIKQQASFGDNIDNLVVGKKITDIEPVDRVGTSSLTAGAFFEAVNTLKTQLES